MDYFEISFFGLFLASFLSATILPIASEGILLLVLAAGFDPINCLLIATLGNSLGGSSNYLIGWFGNPLWLKRAGFKEKNIINFEKRIQRYGSWLALISWLPFIGDPLLLALGFFKAPFFPVIVLMIIGKFLRYFALIIPWLW
jgi:membrane protein YqaA with SNARE-associated domain